MDTTHSNAYTAWLKLGSPQSPSAAQLAQLKSAMALETLSPPALAAADSGIVRQSFDLPRYGVSLIVIEDSAATGLGSGSPPALGGAGRPGPAGAGLVRVYEAGPHTVSVYDAAGRRIAVFRGAGPKTYSLRDLGGGRIYWVRIATMGGERISRNPIP
jgi:hypothetical protein